MKKFVSLVLSCVLCISCSVFAEEKNVELIATKNGFASTKNYTLFDVNLTVPGEWQYNLNNEKAMHEFIVGKDKVFVKSFSSDTEADGFSDIITELYEGYEIVNSMADEYTVNSMNGALGDFILMKDSSVFKGSIYVPEYSSTMQSYICFGYIDDLSDGLIDRDFMQMLFTLNFDTVVNNEVEAIKGEYRTDITYDDLARRPDDYTSEKIQLQGKVLQIIEGDDETQARIAVNSDYNTIVYCGWDKGIVSERILEDDIVNFWGVSIGLLSYESTLKSTITIPGIYVERIERVQ